MAHNGEDLSVVLQAFLAQSGAYDMGVKVASNFISLLLLNTDRNVHPELHYTTSHLVEKFTYFRMLINQWRYPATVRSLFKSLTGNAAQLPLLIYIVSVFMFAFRTVEQLTGDFIYWAGLFPKLRIETKEQLRFRYRFCKFWANLCTIVVESNYLLATTDVETTVAERREKRLERHNVIGLPRVPSSALDLSAFDSEERAKMVAKAEELRSKRLGSKVAVFRAVLEASIYLTWAEWYRPSQMLLKWLGLVSASTGVWLLWHRTKVPPEMRIANQVPTDEVVVMSSPKLHHAAGSAKH